MTNPEVPSAHQSEETPYETYIDDEGNVSVPEDFGATITNEFMHPEEAAGLEAQESAARQEIEYDRFEQMEAEHNIHNAQKAIKDKLDEIALKQRAVLEAELAVADKYDALVIQKRISDLTAKHPDLFGEETE